MSSSRGVGVRRWRWWRTGAVLWCGLGSLTGAASARAATSEMVVVPHVAGQGVLAGYDRLHAAGLRVSVPRGVSFDSLRPPKVARSSPAGGRRVGRGSVVLLYLSCCGRASPPRVPKARLPSYRVPTFVGAGVDRAYLWAAKRMLVFRAYLGMLKAGRAPSLFANYRVGSQRPAAGWRLAVGERTTGAAGRRAAVRWTPLAVWGAQPPPLPPCTPPSGYQVVASNPLAVLTKHAWQDQHGKFVSYFGCLRTDGKQQLVAVDGVWSDPGYESDSFVGQVVLAGRFVGVLDTHDDKYMNCYSTVVIRDLRTAKVETPSDASCFEGYNPTPPAIDSLVLNSDGFAAWRVTKAEPPIALDGVSCPTASMCAAADSAGSMATTTDPTGGPSAWSVADIDGRTALLGVSCPSPSVCVAVDHAGNVLTTSNPTGGASAWTVTSSQNGARPINAVSCPSTSLCIATDDAGNVITSTDPTGGASAWTVTPVESGGTPIKAVSCPSSSLCVATDQAGSLITSSDPTGGPSAWTVSHVSSVNVGAVSCASSSLCVAGTDSGSLITSTNPTGGAPAWTNTSGLGTTWVHAISCPSANLCVAGDVHGELLASTNPTGGAAAWTVAQLPSYYDAIAGLSCPSVSLCVAGATNGNVLTSSQPAASWTSSLIDTPPSCDPTHCLVEQLYAYDTHGTRLLDTGRFGDSISNLTLSGNQLTWTTNGTSRQATLG